MSVHRTPLGWHLSADSRQLRLHLFLDFPLLYIYLLQNTVHLGAFMPCTVRGQPGLHDAVFFDYLAHRNLQSLHGSECLGLFEVLSLLVLAESLGAVT